MVFTLLYLVSGILLFVFFLILLVNVFFGPHMRRGRSSSVNPSVSVLIPARNEEKNIGICLDSLLKQNYDNFRIYVLDDQSEDRTAEIVNNFARYDSRVQLISGKPLPAGWLGKNWACYQLSMHAHGEIIVFADGDTQPASNALRHTVNWIDRYDLGMFSVFPQQISHRFAEQLLVPLIDFILYTLLPLWTVYYIPSSLFAAANGQWLSFTRAAYTNIGGHKSVKTKIVEDVEFSRLMKRNKIKTLTASGTGVVYTRMYRQFRDIWFGLSKSFFGLTGNNILILSIVIFAMLMVYILPILLLLAGYHVKLGLVFVLMIALMRLILAVVYKHNVLISIFFHPIMIIFGIFIAINSLYTTKKGKLLWKGRNISASTG
jgi:cellulose synthase/poly-beta-1,6-N-acetylglucosamine synthase-like glycosyltransferase